MLDVLVQIDAKKHPKKAEEINFEREAHGEFQEDQIEGQRRADTGGPISGENSLNSALWGHDPEDFTQDSA